MKKFVVSAPSWFPSSGGITILHKLVNDLNLLGYDAYLAPSGPSGLGWHPPNMDFNVSSKYSQIKLITEDIYSNLEDSIVIYPETWYGNYLNAPNVVRWIMGPANPMYMSSGNLYGIQYDEWKDTDLWFWYTPMYRTSVFNSFNKDLENILYVPEFNRDIFKDTSQERTMNCWTLRKASGKISESDYIHEPSDVFFGDIDKSLPNPDYDFPGKYRELADVFNKTKTFYSYDAYTFVSIQAVMCGADSVVFPMKELTKEEYYSGYELHKYIAYGKDELERARSVRNEFDDHLTDIENKSVENIHTFVEKCHDYFR